MRRALLVLIWMLLFLAVVDGGVAETLISDVKITGDEEIEKVQLVFQTAYSETVSTDFEKGVVQISFPHATFDPSLAFTNVNDRFIQNIRLIKTATSSIMEVRFADPDFDAVGMVKEESGDQHLTLLVSKTGPFPVEKPNKIGELGTIPQKETGNHDNVASSGVPFLDSDMTMSIVKMLVALFLLLLFFYLLLWVYNRFFVSRFQFRKGKYNIRVSSSHHISPKQKVMVLEVNGEAYACGVTANNISVIAKVSKDSFSDFLTGLDTSGEISFADIRTRYLEAKKEREIQEQSTDTDSKFASELIQRIRNLKPLD